MNHNIPSTTKAPVDETEHIETNHERGNDQTATKLGSVALDTVAEPEINPAVEHMKKVEQAFFGSPDDLMKKIEDGEIGVNDIDFGNRTPVMMMTARGAEQVVRRLIDQGADLNRINMYQGRIPMSALDAARQTRRASLEQLLLENGAKTGRDIYDEQLAAQQDK
jgi:hypothetical protein